MLCIFSLFAIVLATNKQGFSFVETRHPPSGSGGGLGQGEQRFAVGELHYDSATPLQLVGSHSSCGCVRVLGLPASLSRSSPFPVWIAGDRQSLGDSVYYVTILTDRPDLSPRMEFGKDSARLVER